MHNVFSGIVIKEQLLAAIRAADIYFSDRLSNKTTTFPFGYGPSAAANHATIKYVMCAPSTGGITSWSMQVLQSLVGAAPVPWVDGRPRLPLSDCPSDLAVILFLPYVIKG